MAQAHTATSQFLVRSRRPLMASSMSRVSGGHLGRLEEGGASLLEPLRNFSMRELSTIQGMLWTVCQARTLAAMVSMLDRE